MATNKNALNRYLVIDRCISNATRKYSWEDLLKEVNEKLNDNGYEGIGRTQIFNDISYLQNSDYAAPIVKHKEGRKVYYRYDDANYSIRNNPLTQNEYASIHNALEVLSNIGGIKQFDWVNELILKLETKLGINTTKKEFMSFQHNDDYVGLNFLNDFMNAIQHERVLKIEYKDFKSELPYEIIFHPYYLKQFNNRWYAIGNNQKESIETWNIAFDRIISTSETITSKYIPSSINWSDYFSDFVGVTKLIGEIEVIELIIQTELQAKYIQTNPIHETQKSIKKTVLGYETSISVIPNFELEKLLLSFGQNIKVKSPDSLVKKMKEHFTQALLLY